MARTAGKSKTRQSVAKRYKLTGSGKLKRAKQGRRHLALSKNRKRKRNLRKSTLVSAADAKTVMKNLPFA